MKELILRDKKVVIFEDLRRILNRFSDCPVSKPDKIAVASHSMGSRSFVAVSGSEPETVPDDHFNGHWSFLGESDFTEIRFVSASSGSVLEASYWPQRDVWVLTLEVPMKENGSPYEGNYWQAFYEAGQKEA